MQVASYDYETVPLVACAFAVNVAVFFLYVAIPACAALAYAVKLKLCAFEALSACDC